jgi:quinoprotein glucose dehydrogenase
VEGLVHSGILKEETDKLIRLMSPQGAIITIAKDDIDERAKGQSGMPVDITKNLSRSDVRDLVQYLSTLKMAGTSSHGQEE